MEYLKKFRPSILVEIHVCCHKTYLSISNLHFIFFSPVQRRIMPESCRLLLIMFSSFRLVSDPRSVARTEQLLSVKLQTFSLQEKINYIIKLNAYNTFVKYKH